MVLSAGTAWLIFLIGRQAFNAPVGRLAAAVVWLYPAFIFFNVTFFVQHFHNARLSMMNTGSVALETAVTRDKILINLGELSGNIWTTRLQ